MECSYEYGNETLGAAKCGQTIDYSRKTQFLGASWRYFNEQRELGRDVDMDVIVVLLLFQVAMATGQVLFQRFYYSKSFVRCAMETTAMGCVCLASKIEEAPRRIRDVINVFHHIKQVKSQK